MSDVMSVHKQASFYKNEKNFVIWWYTFIFNNNCKLAQNIKVNKCAHHEWNIFAQSYRKRGVISILIIGSHLRSFNFN